MNENYTDRYRELEAEVQKLRAQNHRPRLAIEEAARMIWIKPNEAEEILSNALE